MWRLRVSSPRMLALGRRLSRLVGGGGAGGVSPARLTLVSASVGVVAGTGYSVYTHYRINNKKPLVPAETLEYTFLPQAPPYKPHYKVESAGGAGRDLEIVLFQYGTCPFCCKVRAYLDARGIAYDLVEVDAVLRQAISWSQYKKVPIVLAKVDGGYQQLYDSTAIISILETHIRGGAAGPSRLQTILQCYPRKIFMRDDGTRTSDIVNKYFLMHHDNTANIDNKTESEERKWRQWADDTLVHVLSPNVYRTLDEAYATFSWFAESAQWRAHFPAWEVALMENVGAVAMWLISKRLKKRHCLKEDVRESLYDAGRAWCAAVRRATGSKHKFHGGAEPDLADLAVYGVLSSIEGCGAFADLRARTDVGSWYDAVRAHVDSSRGHTVALLPAASALA